EAASRKAHNRRLDLAHLVDQFFADSFNVGNLGVLTHPHAVVDHAAEILGEVSVDVGRDRAEWFCRQHLDAGVRPGGVEGGGPGRMPGEEEPSGSDQTLPKKVSALNHGTASLELLREAVYT